MRSNKFIKYVTVLYTCIGKWKTQLHVFLSSPADSTEWSSLMLQLRKYRLHHPVHRKVGKLQIWTWYVIERNFCPCWEVHTHHPGDQESLYYSLGYPGFIRTIEKNIVKFCVPMFLIFSVFIFFIQTLYRTMPALFDIL